jgi:hypothetical protein
MSFHSKVDTRNQVQWSRPTVKTRLCLGDRAVPVVTLHEQRFLTIQAYSTSVAGEPHSMMWLMKPLGIRVFQWEKDLSIRASGVAGHVREAIERSRGCHLKQFAKVDATGLVCETLTVDVRGRKVTVGNQLWPLLLKATRGNLKWLLWELKRDVGSTDDPRTSIWSASRSRSSIEDSPETPQDASDDDAKTGKAQWQADTISQRNRIKTLIDSALKDVVGNRDTRYVKFTNRESTIFCLWLEFHFTLKQCGVSHVCSVARQVRVVASSEPAAVRRTR